MNELGFIAIGVMLTLGCLRILAAIERDEERRRRQQAEAVLRRHGMSIEMYLASAGVSDPELADALDHVGATGHIVTDHCGSPVGDLCRCAGTGRPLLVYRARRIRF
ncbi:hypothetical protein [Massilia sp. CCM 8734]|uniref:hypothetical protein n=1 Tax=Massilia sp. CCM 8734 TaxID=2609283 RepID=UPI00141F8118|nr:hypothetical protein [Massilia sp. CCM 8734]NHZ99045.1 hypothetical protein [Massilia sp. CCM 8734]